MEFPEIHYIHIVRVNTFGPNHGNFYRLISSEFATFESDNMDEILGELQTQLRKSKAGPLDLRISFHPRWSASGNINSNKPSNFEIYSPIKDYDRNRVLYLLFPHIPMNALQGK